MTLAAAPGTPSCRAIQHRDLEAHLTTLIAIYNSEGCVGRCDACCYDAHEPDCGNGSGMHGAAVTRQRAWAGPAGRGDQESVFANVL
jgi:hypothetical protein